MASMKPHEQRVIDERTEMAAVKTTMEERREKLIAFQSSPVFENIHEADKLLLCRQEVEMADAVKRLGYLIEILDERIARFPKE